ncbi:MAG: phosphopantothenoylcysteine decarboxylase domain-containing protein [Planctomycetota bacterium]|jgi:phosphopantothenoylcysteine decarboxylase/phosphopantothenate--cysteine ligase
MTDPLPFLHRVLITAGPTHEPIDSVRYLANRSSGRMGIALADAATARGWPTTLLLGPTALLTPDHSHLQVIRFRTTADLQAALLDEWPRHDILFMAAAVADYRPAGPPSTGKIRRGRDPLRLDLEPTPDLLALLDTVTRPGQIRVGFALESPEHLAEAAACKLAAKRLDAIVANPLDTMDSETVTATVFRRTGPPLEPPGNLSKPRFAAWLLDHVDELAGDGG